MGIEAVLKLAIHLFIQLTVGSATRGNMLDMGNLAVISGLGTEMIKKSLNFHNSLSLHANNLDFIIEYLDIEAGTNHKVDYSRKNLIGMPIVIADTADPYR